METAPGLHCAVTRAPGAGEGPRCRLRGNSPEIEACLLRTTGNDAALTCNHKLCRDDVCEQSDAPLGLRRALQLMSGGR